MKGIGLLTTAMMFALPAAATTTFVSIKEVSASQACEMEPNKAMDELEKSLGIPFRRADELVEGINEAVLKNQVTPQLTDTLIKLEQYVKVSRGAVRKAYGSLPQKNSKSLTAMHALYVNTDITIATLENMLTLINLGLKLKAEGRQITYEEAAPFIQKSQEIAERTEKAKKYLAEVKAELGVISKSEKAAFSALSKKFGNALNVNVCTAAYQAFARK